MTTPGPTRTTPPAENPILDETELARWSVTAPRPVPKANSRLVFVDNKGKVLAPERPMTLSEVVWGGLRRMYEVDMREHRAKFHAQVPCREKGFSFDVEFELSWRVADPAQIVMDGRTDVGPVYRGYLIDRVSEQSERYGLEDRLAAEKGLKQTLAGVSLLPEGIGLRNCALTLRLSAEAEAHFKNRTLDAFETEKRHMRHAATLDQAELDRTELAASDQTEVLKGQLRARHRRRQLEEQQQISDLQNQLEIQETQHRLALEKQEQLAKASAELEVSELKRKLERLQAEHQLEIESERRKAETRVKVERMELYKKALESGDVASLIPIFLDEHPEDVGQLLNLMVSQHRDNREHARKILEAMLEAGVVNSRDLDDTRRAALQRLLEGLSTNALGASIDDRKPPAIEPTADEAEDAEDEDEDPDD